MRFSIERCPSPVSTLLLVTDEKGILRALEFVDYEERMHRLLRLHYGDYTLQDGSVPTSIRKSLTAYFDGRVDALDDIIVATGGTAFQRDVWKALRQIPAGSTLTYGQLATKIGRDGASRAVGAANGANPISLVVPCHRVIGANGSLTGYASGVERKKWLLEHERRSTPSPGSATS